MSSSITVIWAGALTVSSFCLDSRCWLPCSWQWTADVPASAHPLRSIGAAPLASRKCARQRPVRAGYLADSGFLAPAQIQLLRHGQRMPL
jgi:hypothetical protein